MTENVLELVDVTKTYASPSGESLRILDSISVRVASGESTAVIGPSGSGKSTLLNIMGGLDRPDSGRVLLGGKDLAGLSDSELSRLRCRKIGFVFQQHHLLPQCTLLENVLIPTIPAETSEDPAQVRIRAMELLESAGLGKRMDYYPSRLSGGELQRGALVRALINRPALILADEPTGSLDRNTSEDVMDILLELMETQQVSLVTVTHAPHVAEKMDRPFLLDNGELRQQ